MYQPFKLALIALVGLCLPVAATKKPSYKELVDGWHANHKKYVADHASRAKLIEPILTPVSANIQAEIDHSMIEKVWSTLCNLCNINNTDTYFLRTVSLLTLFGLSIYPAYRKLKEKENRKQLKKYCTLIPPGFLLTLLYFNWQATHNRTINGTS